MIANGTITGNDIAANTIIDENIKSTAAIAATKVQGTVASGGTTGQFLKKSSGTDYETTWSTVAGAVYQPSAPVSPQNGDIWIDSDATASVINTNDFLTKNDFELFTSPIGSVTTFAGTASPSNKWAICDGTAVSRTTYATLFSVIGTTYGVGNGSTTFNLPNLKGRTIVGVDASQTEFDALGETGGAKSVTLTSAQSGLPAHSHGITDPGHAHYLNWLNNVNVANFAGAYGSVGSNAPGTTFHSTTGISINNNTAANAAEAHTNLQPYIALNYLIRIA
jgi:microcystin-dependent protein